MHDSKRLQSLIPQCTININNNYLSHIEIESPRREEQSHVSFRRNSGILLIPISSIIIPECSTMILKNIPCWKTVTAEKATFTEVNLLQ